MSAIMTPFKPNRPDVAVIRHFNFRFLYGIPAATELSRKRGRIAANGRDFSGRKVDICTEGIVSRPHIGRLHTLHDIVRGFNESIDIRRLFYAAASEAIPLPQPSELAYSKTAFEGDFRWKPIHGAQYLCGNNRHGKQDSTWILRR